MTSRRRRRRTWVVIVGRLEPGGAFEEVEMLLEHGAVLRLRLVKGSRLDGATRLEVVHGKWRV